MTFDLDIWHYVGHVRMSESQVTWREKFAGGKTKARLAIEVDLNLGL